MIKTSILFRDTNSVEALLLSLFAHSKSTCRRLHTQSPLVVVVCALGAPLLSSFAYLKGPHCPEYTLEALLLSYYTCSKAFHCHCLYTRSSLIVIFAHSKPFCCHALHPQSPFVVIICILEAPLLSLSANLELWYCRLCILVRVLLYPNKDYIPSASSARQESSHPLFLSQSLGFRCAHAIVSTPTSISLPIFVSTYKAHIVYQRPLQSSSHVVYSKQWLHKAALARAPRFTRLP